MTRALLASLAAATLSLAVTAACGGGQAPPAESGSTAADAPTITGPRAHELVAAGATLLDVSPAARFPQTRLEGAINIPITELESRMGELPRDRPIVVYCGGGRASPRAASMLRAAGYDVHLLGARANWDR